MLGKSSALQQATHPKPLCASPASPWCSSCWVIQGVSCTEFVSYQMRETYLKKEAMANRGQTYDAIRKLLATLDDPFTRFLEPSRLAALRRGTAGVRLGVSAQAGHPPAVTAAGCKASVQQVAPVPYSACSGSLLLTLKALSSKLVLLGCFVVQLLGLDLHRAKPHVCPLDHQQCCMQCPLQVQ